jgi:hypothetical protein
VASEAKAAVNPGHEGVGYATAVSPGETYLKEATGNAAGRADMYRRWMCGTLTVVSTFPRGFQPMTAAELDVLAKRCAPAAGDGHLELYKPTMKYDRHVGRAKRGIPSHKEIPL